MTSDLLKEEKPKPPKSTGEAVLHPLQNSPELMYNASTLLMERERND